MTNRNSIALLTVFISLFLTIPTIATEQSRTKNEDPVMPDSGYPETGYVRIVRDTYGVPHVYASNDKDLYYGFGYALPRIV